MNGTVVHHSGQCTVQSAQRSTLKRRQQCPERDQQRAGHSILNFYRITELWLFAKFNFGFQLARNFNGGVSLCSPKTQPDLWASQLRKGEK